MSTLPPEPGAAEPVIPWERRRNLDPVQAFIETIKMFATRPDEAWRITPERGGIESPLLFALLIEFFGALVSFIYKWIFGNPWVRWFPREMFRRFGPWWSYRQRPAGCGIVAFPFATAIAILIGLFVVSAILHLFILMVGAARNSASGFEGTFRVVSYSAVASLGQLIPVVGGLVACVWWIVLAVKGIVRMHRTTSGRAASAILIPFAVIIGLLFLVMVVVFGLLWAAHRGSSYSV
ncbi:MAG TPA: YIP1 family protein [Thermoanaerobaculia bacterium]|nr:YIP1 family protein [Thermoanaerobaculia bacterium]